MRSAAAQSDLVRGGRSPYDSEPFGDEGEGGGFGRRRRGGEDDDDELADIMRDGVDEVGGFCVGFCQFPVLFLVVSSVLSVLGRCNRHQVRNMDAWNRFWHRLPIERVMPHSVPPTLI